ncbi:MAG TPA: TlpA family protein disulfide reductase [Verrucomicrobia subdivision 3 bacterium]|nr:TlpA family protein disulfide reductase [Limisphaerales bacterium]
MKIKSVLPLFAAVALFALPVPAQTTTNVLATELRALVQQVQTKLRTGKTTEADLAPELQKFDSLLAAHAGEKTDELAQVRYMKAMLYAEVLKDTAKADEMLKQLKADFKGTKFVDRLEKQEAALGEAKKVQSALGTGLAFPDFSEKDLNGQPLSVGALKGKVVLVDFWATWCGPCRAELPNVIATYKKHHGQGFEIIGISLDSDRDKLDAFLKQTDGMRWPQFFDGQGWSNKIAVKYGVQSIPFTVLVGPDGKIIGKDLRGEELENAVSAALTKK